MKKRNKNPMKKRTGQEEDDYFFSSINNIVKVSPNGRFLMVFQKGGFPRVFIPLFNIQKTLIFWLLFILTIHLSPENMHSEACKDVVAEFDSEAPTGP